MSEEKKEETTPAPVEPAATPEKPVEPKAEGQLVETKSETPGTLAAQDKASAKGKQSAKVKLPAWQRWRRRLRITFVTVLLALLAFRVLLQVMLPYVIRRTAAGYGLAASYERQEIDLFGGDVGIWHLVIRPIEGGDPLVQAEYCRGDVSTLDLLRGRLVVRRLETEGLDVLVERKANGDIPLLQRFTAKSTGTATSAGSASPAASTPGAKPQDIDLSSPFELDAFRLDHVRTHIRDMSVNPPLDALVETNLRLTDLKSILRPTRIELEVSAAPMLDSLKITGEGASKGKNLDAKLYVAVRGLHPRQAEGYLRPMGIKPLGYNLSADMSVRLKTTASTRAGCVAATAALTDISVYADGEESVALDALTINADSLSGSVAQIASVLIDGVRCTATRSKEGNVRVAGLEFSAAPAAPATAPTIVAQSTKPAPAKSTAAAPTTQPAFEWSVAELAIHHVDATVHDWAVSPAATLELNVEDFTVKNLLKDPHVPMQLSATVLAPGAARSIKLTGTALPFASPKTADLALTIDGIDPTALQPYLEAAGLESELKSGTLTCAVHASISEKAGLPVTDAQLSNVRFGDGGELLALDDVHITGFGMDVLSNLIHVDEIEITGPRFGAKRDAAGVLEALGFRVKPRSKTAAAPAATAPPKVEAPAAGSAVVSTAPPAAGPAFPRVQVGKFVWKGVHVHVEDAGQSSVSTFDLEDAGIEMNGLLLDLDPKPGEVQPPAQVHAWLKLPGVIGSIDVTGTITPQAEGTVADLEVTGKGLKGAAVASYLEFLGIEATLHDGTLHMKTRVSVAQRKDGLSALMAIDDLQLQDEGKELVALDHLDIPNIDVRPGEISIDQPIVINKPRLRAGREKDGSLTFAGIHVLPVARKAAPSPTGFPAAPPAPVAAEASQLLEPSHPAQPPATQPPQVVILKSLRVKDASVTWSDLAAPQPVDASLTASVDVDDFVMGKPAPPANIKVLITSPGSLDKMTVTGTVTPDPAAPLAHLDIVASGMKPGPLTPYLPPQLKSKLKDGQFRATLDAGLQANAKGGNQGHLFVTNLDYRDGAAGPSLFKFDAMRLVVSRFDPEAPVIAVDELSLAGLETELHQTATGPSLLGFLLDQSAAASAVMPPPAPKAAKPQAGAATLPAAVPALAVAPIVDHAPIAPAVTAADVARAVAQTKRKLPLITVEKLDIGVSKISVIDETRSGSAPLVISDLHLKNHGRIELLGDKPEDRPPIDVELSCKPAPLAKSFSMHITKTAPFALQPTAQIDLAAEGVTGDGLLAAVPELKEAFDGKELTDGRFKAHLEATVIRIDRENLLRFDFSRPLDADVLVKGVEWRNGTAGPLLAGVEEIRSEGVHIDPATGAVTAKSVDISNLGGQAIAEKDGIHAMGLILKMPTAEAPTTAPTTAASTQPTPVAPVAVAVAAAKGKPAPAATAPTRPPPEIRVDKFTISGINFRLEDRRVDPVLVIPINSFDLEVRDFTTLMFTQEKSIRFSLLANADKVELPKPGAPGKTEERELLSQITASGNLSFYPKPKGWAKASMSGLELASLKGEARAAGIDLSAGTFDADVDARLKGDGSMDIHPKFVFNDLALSEPAGGPVQRTLGLPATLDVVIGALKDASGQITVNLNVPIEKGKLDTGSVVLSASGAFVGIVTVAVASAPLKLGNSVTSLVGLDLLKKKKEAPVLPVVASFGPGDTTPVLIFTHAIDPLLAQAKKDPSVELVIRHELGSSDVALEGVRANPSADDAQSLADQLRERKMVLLKERAIVAGQARAELASGLGGAGTIDRLRAIDRDLAETENGMDNLYDLLRPGADHQKARRTRAACLTLGDERLAAVHDLIVAAGPGLAGRIRLTPVQFNPADSDAGRVIITSSKSK